MLRRLLVPSGLKLGVLVGLLIFGLQLWGGSGGFLYQLELKAVDARQRFRGPRKPDPRVAILAIDDRSLDAYGQWPWPRNLVGELVTKAFAAGAKAVALDIVFSEPARCDPAEDEALAAALQPLPRVVLGYFFRLPGKEEAGRAARRSGGSEEQIHRSEINVAQGPQGGYQILEAAAVETNIDRIGMASPNLGFFTITPDADGVVRFYYSLLQYPEDHFYPSLAVKGLQQFLDGANVELSPYQRVLPRIRIGETLIHNDEEGRILLNFRGPGRTFPHLSAADLLAGTLDRAGIEGKLVFIGITETGVGDIRATPFDPATPGVEVHATAADNILRGEYLYRTFASDLWDGAVLLALCGLVGWLATRFVSPLHGLAVAAGVLLLFVSANYVAFTRFSLWLNLVTPVIGVVLSFTAASVYQNFFAEAKARLIRKTFQQVVSPVVVEEMLRNPDKIRLGGERRELTVLFSDIRGFTSISERLSPEAVLEVLNEYLTPMTRIIFEQQGTFDKYMGDGIMAIWNAPTAQPQHPLQACRAAFGMKEALVELNQRWGKTRRLPEVRIGVGINTGPMSVGYMGSEMIKSYTVLGDNVNLASRIEGLTKYYQIDIAVSDDTRARASGEFFFREMDRVRVVGKKEAVTVYQLVDRLDRLGARRKFYDLYHQALERYRARDFRGSMEGFQQAQALAPEDFTTTMYLNRARVYAVKPPDIDWDGVYELEGK